MYRIWLSRIHIANQIRSLYEAAARAHFQPMRAQLAELAVNACIC
jgi:hypothetical protein